MQVRVATYAFAGSPVRGDRPDTKHSPYILRLLSEDLLSVARTATGADTAGSSAIVFCRRVISFWIISLRIFFVLSLARSLLL